MKKDKKKPITVWVPLELHTMAKKMCIEYETNLTAIFVDYLCYLQKKHPKQRDPLNGKSKKDFLLDDDCT